MTTTFEELNLKPELLKAIDAMGFESPTPIQAGTIPPLLAGRDILGQAQTGTGKTAAFGLPLLNKIDPDGGLQGLVICPTRELAVQVAMEITNLGRFLRLRAIPVYGGQSIDHQIRSLRMRPQPQVVVATPGRLMDHLRRRTIDLRGLSTVIMDEADEMLDMGFLEDIQYILSKCPSERQSMLFAATMPSEIRELAKSFMQNPEVVAFRGIELTAPLIEQRYYEVHPRQKVETLCRILDVESPGSAIIFCNTKRGADDLVQNLRLRGYSAEVLHGDLSQRERDSVMTRFRQGQIELLIASDVASRGLDISHVTHVINYDIAQSPDSYVNRVGRTGRAGREGVAITLVAPREAKHLRFIEGSIGKKIKRHTLPTLEEAIERRQQQLVERIIENLDGSLAEYRPMAARLLDEYESVDLLAVALKMLDDAGRDLERSEILDAPVEKERVRIPLGRIQGINPQKLVDHLVHNTEIGPSQVGNIDILDNWSFVQIPASFVDEVNTLFKLPDKLKRRSAARRPRPRPFRR
ncbi:MAG: DEAD/DEAH box helicase [Candidatus Desulforudaceae bacterium]|nr:DEAD/DEAH box helicase [Bacillota bacterium]MBV1727203.1 DEAD/DEAH box helicase [Desulforudis sp.]MBV1735696.1 DEAD/DEAH box helicase [Desulforudis sp.]